MTREPSASRVTPRTWKWSAPRRRSASARSESSVGPAVGAGFVAVGSGFAEVGLGAGAGGLGRGSLRGRRRRRRRCNGLGRRRGRLLHSDARRSEGHELGLGQQEDHPAQRVGVAGKGRAELLQAADSVDVGRRPGLLRIQHQIGQCHASESPCHRQRAAHAQARLDRGRVDPAHGVGEDPPPASHREAERRRRNAGFPAPGAPFRQECLPDQPGPVLLQLLEARRRVEEAQLDERTQDVAVEGGGELPGVCGLLGPEEPSPDQELGQVLLLAVREGVLDDAAPVDERPDGGVDLEDEAPGGLGGGGEVMEVERALVVQGSRGREPGGDGRGHRDLRSR